MPANLPLDPNSLPPGTKVGGDYTVEARIGGSGQRALYRVSRGTRISMLKISTAERASVKEVKRIPAHDRLLGEVSILLGLSHRNVVELSAQGWWPDASDGYPYFVMDHVEGDPVLRWQEKTRPSLRAICGVFQQVADALRVLHEMGIVHRDVKSDNLLVRQDGTPVMVGFGRAGRDVLLIEPRDPVWARDVRKERAKTGERYDFKPSDDARAIGLLLYEMLAGRAPSIFARRVRAGPRKLNPKVPAALDGIVIELLEKDPELRMGALELIGKLKRALYEADAAWDVPFGA